MTVTSDALLVGASKGWTSGTHRSRSPAATFALVAPHFDRVGITRVADVTGLDTIGVPVMLAVRPTSWSLSVSQGKGTDRQAARTSAVMESIECWCAERSEPDVEATLAEVGPGEAIDISSFLRVGAALPADVEVPWSEGVELGSGETVLVPHGAVHVDCRVPRRRETEWFVTTSNGLASGNVREEALVHALAELVERDAVARFQGSPPVVRRSRRVDPGSVEDRRCVGVLDRFTEADVAVSIWDLTSEVGVAVYAAAIADARPNPFRRVPVARGYGCHPHPGVALLRALTEAAQCRLTVIAGSREDHDPIGYERLRDPASDDRLGHPAEPLPHRPVRAGAAPDRSTRSFGDDLAVLVEGVARAGAGSVVAVDIDARGLPVSVVRAVAPGLAGAGVVSPRALLPGAPA